MSNSWWDQVSGSNEYERQSWRDNFNGGKAAGDWTGNTNRRIEAEREAFQGTTWSGSSSQPSALELAQSMASAARSGSPAVSGGAGASVAAGPGNAVVQTGTPAEAVPTKGAGQRVVISGPGAPLKVKTKDEVTGLKLGGDWFQPNPWFSNTDQWEERWGEPGDWLGGVVTFFVDSVYNADRVRQAGPAVVGGTIDRVVEDYQRWPIADEESYFNPLDIAPMAAW